MNHNTLSVHQNEDGTFSIEWDKKDPQWSWLNGLTGKEIQTIIEEAIKNDSIDDF